MIKKIGILGALSELLDPHLFGRTGALKFGAIGVHQRGRVFPACTEPSSVPALSHSPYEERAYGEEDSVK